MKEWRGRKGGVVPPEPIQPPPDGQVVTKEYRVPVDSFTAKKDFEIHHNDYHRVIKAGDDVSDVPEHYHPNLKTEGVI